MSNQKFIIANWKMNIPHCGIEEYCKSLENAGHSNMEVIIACPSIFIDKLANNFKQLKFASQNITHLTDSFGAFTGELSAKMISDLGISYSIIGHMERRKYLFESDEDIFKKAEFLNQFGIAPIFCFGEDKIVRDQNKTQEFIQSQLIGLEKMHFENLILAYEPVWAIGTNLTLENEAIAEIASFVKDRFSKIAKNIKFVYGGSVNSGNVKSLSVIDCIDGVLVGGASLNLNEFQKIIEAYA